MLAMPWNDNSIAFPSVYLLEDIRLTEIFRFKTLAAQQQ